MKTKQITNLMFMVTGFLYKKKNKYTIQLRLEIELILFGCIYKSQMLFG